MANFENGVKSYINAYAVVEVNFPVDWRNNAEINCYQCPFFSRNNGICQLNKQVVAFPQRYVGDNCPLEIKED